MQKTIDITDEQLKRIQKESFEIAKYLVEFCDKHNLRIYLYCGSLLGAIRHKGFIPWDDDIDMMMPAPDYYKLLELWDEEADTDKYSLCYQTKTYNDHTLTASVRNNYTTFITTNTYNTDGNQGIAIDLDAFHAIPNSKIGRTIQLILACGCSLFKAGRLPNRQSKLVYNASRILLGIFRTDRVRYYIWRTLERLATIPDKHYDKAKYVREFTMFPCITWLMPKEWYDTGEKVDFEDTKMPIPAGAREYLTLNYGNYMEFPPEEKRHPECNVLFMDLDTPFTQHKDKYGKNTFNGKYEQ